MIIIFVKNYLKKLDHNDNLIITAHHVAETFEQAICSDFQTTLTESFWNGLMEDKNGDILAKVLMKHNESEQNIWLNYKTRPGRGQNIAKKDSIKNTANTLKTSLIENLISNVKEQNQNDVLVKHALLFHIQRIITLDEWILILKKIHALYGTYYVHRAPEERYGWDKFEITLCHLRKISCKEEEIIKEFKTLWPISNRVWPHRGLEDNNVAFGIQVLSISAIKCQDDFRIFQFASAIRWQKKLPRTQQNLCILHRFGFGIPQHFATGCDLVF